MAANLSGVNVIRQHIQTMHSFTFSTTLQPFSKQFTKPILQHPRSKQQSNSCSRTKAIH